MKKVFLFLITVIFYIITVNLSLSTGLLVLGLFGLGCVFAWVIPIFDLHAIISTATTGNSMPINYTPALVAAASFLGGIIGFIVAHKELQHFLVDIFTP